MQKPRFLAVLQAATDDTEIPLTMEAIEWAITEKYRPSAAFNRSVRKDGLDGKVGVGVWRKEGGAYSKHVLLFDPKDWDRMSHEQHNKVYQLIERIITGAQHLKPRTSSILVPMH